MRQVRLFFDKAADVISTLLNAAGIGLLDNNGRDLLALNERHQNGWVHEMFQELQIPMLTRIRRFDRVMTNLLNGNMKSPFILYSSVVKTGKITFNIEHESYSLIKATLVHFMFKF